MKRNLVLIGTTVWLCLLFWVVPVLAIPVTFDFEDLSDLTKVDDFYLNEYGMWFENAVALTAGFSLNEYDYLPTTGEKVIGDSGGALAIHFDTGITSFAADFTFGSRLTFRAFNFSGDLIEEYLTPEESNLGSSARFSFDWMATEVAYMQIFGETPDSFILDTLTANFSDSEPPQPTPEPASFLLLGSGLLIGTFLARRKKLT